MAMTEEQRQRLKAKSSMSEMSDEDIPRKEVVEKSRHNGLRFLILFIVCVAIVVSFAGVQEYAKTLINDASVNIVDLNNELDTVKNTVSDDQAVAIETSTGINESKKEHDDGLAKSFFTTACTWSSYDEYVSVRNKLINEGYTADSSFMTTFLPEVTEFSTNFGYESDGTSNIIDAYHLNMSLSSMTSYVTSVGDNYTYFTVVKVTTANANGATASGTIVATYRVVENSIVDIEAYSVAE